MCVFSHIVMNLNNEHFACSFVTTSKTLMCCINKSGMEDKFQMVDFYLV